MKNIPLYLLLTILCFYSCQDQIVDIELPLDAEPDSDSLLLWKIPLSPDTLNAVSVDVIYNNEKIITSVNPSSTSENEIILCFDQEGDELWRWEDYVQQDNPQRIDNVFIYQESYILSSIRDNYCLDLESGLTKWEYYNFNGLSYLSNSMDLIFKSTSIGGAAHKPDSSQLLIADIEVGSFKEIFKVSKTDDFFQFMRGCVAFINDELDTILVFQSRQYKLSPYEDRIDLYAYNLTKKELVWMNHDIMPFGSSNIRPSIDDKNYIYFAGQFHFSCFEKETGTLVWERLLPHDFQGSNYLLYEDLLITNLDNGDLIAINKHNGETVWHKAGLSACCTELRIYDDKIYIGNGDLFIVDALTGIVLYRYETSTKGERGRSNALFLNAIAVDEDHQRMYATDGYYLLCLKHPEL